MSAPIATFATLTNFRQRQALADSDTADDARLLAKLRSASSQIRRYTGRDFLPTLEVRRFDYRKPYSLTFRGMDMLELGTITNGDGTLIDPAAIQTIGASGGIVGVELDPNRAMFTSGATPVRCLAVSGTWGWHDDYANAWRASGETIPVGGLLTTATTLTVTNVSAADTWGLAPRLQTGQLLRIDSEFLFVVNVGGNTLTVVRGVNGTTVVAHTAGATISTYAPPADIVEITLRWAAWLAKVEDAGDYGGQTSDASVGRITIPPGLPADLRETLMHFRAVTVASSYRPVLA